MAEDDKTKTVNGHRPHYHYHNYWPGSDCSCAGAMIAMGFFILVYWLATLRALPWQ
ncbi:MAG: hypothetical protein AB7L09_00415 [Nitrospira sp.]